MKITVITIALNQALTIGRTINSVLQQDYDNFEYLIIDGGSTDNTTEIVRGCQPRFNGRLRLISKKDNGLYEAINNGIKNATGDVIGILHADDVFTSTDILSEVAKAMSDESVDLVYGDIHYINKRYQPDVIRYYSAEQFIPAKLRFGFAPPHPSLYCRKEIFDRFGLYNESYRTAGDFEFFTRILWNTDVKSLYLPIDMVTMTIGGISSTWRNRLTTNITEKRRALRENNVRSSYLLLMFKYAFALKHYFKVPYLLDYSNLKLHEAYK